MTLMFTDQPNKTLAVVTSYGQVTIDWDMVKAVAQDRDDPSWAIATILLYAREQGKS